MTTEVMPPAARELTAKEREAWGKKAYKIEERIRDGFARGRKALWDTAQALTEFDDVEGWLALGHENKSEWLAQNEIGLTDRTYRRLVRSYRELVVVRKVDRTTLADLDASKVDVVLPAIEQGSVTLEKALSDVKSLPARDLRITYYGEPKPRQKPAGDASQHVNGGPPETDEGLGEIRADDVATGDGSEEVIEVDESAKSPTKAEYDDMVKRAKKRRRNFKQYAQWVGKWALIDGTDGSKPEHWLLPAEESQGAEPNLAQTTSSLQANSAVVLRAWEDIGQAIVSGTEHPRVDVNSLRAVFNLYAPEVMKERFDA